MTLSLLYLRDKVDTTLAPTLKANFTRHLFQGKDIKADSEFWDSIRRAWLFTRLITLDGLQDYRYFTELYASVYKPEADIDVPKLLKTYRTTRNS